MSQTGNMKAITWGQQGASADEAWARDLNLANLNRHNVQGIYEDLLPRLEQNVGGERMRFVDDYIATMVKREEMATLWADPAFYRQLKAAIVNELLPLYDRYQNLRQKAEQKVQQTTWSRYCLWTMGICLGVEAFLSEGRVLRPQLLIPAAIVDGLLGCAIWYLANFKALKELRELKRRFDHSVEELVQKQEVSDRYEVFRTYTGGELLKAELDQLLASYHDTSEFWYDYYRVRQADPTTPQQLKELGIGRFANFLELHVGGTYSAESRAQRFDALFLLAHKAFILADRKNYVLNNLAPQLRAKETTRI
jgi:hypothetical protein